ncbi:hypothetical protein [Desulforamulus aeronauticus]|uniref:Uncharacterized protein n=1 Tax=Desulforamulus aeronauticus DSM 10349 TaxID=1121421 RepID=A0A1M6QQX6_9FIRM|nr:hypothetical protein [Desulforamulus aeronauticus]SHK22575.1 hypothetical protein SAMN02745123_01132 [Desulforamulus aeronauticus DSM 10349]
MTKQKKKIDDSKAKNPKGNYFVFIVLIIYVMIASQAVKNYNQYLQSLQLAPGTYLVLSLGGIVLLGSGLVILNNLVQKWLSKKMQ